jgi:ABC-type iron transport system FetAB permease component
MLFSYFFFRIHPKHVSYAKENISVTLCCFLYALLFIILYDCIRSLFGIELNFVSNLLFKILFAVFIFVVFIFFCTQKWKKICDRLDHKFYKYRVPGFIIALISEIFFYVYVIFTDGEWIVDYINYPLTEEIINCF